MKRYLKVLAVLVLGLAVVAGIGSAGALTATEALDLHMVEGSFANIDDVITAVSYEIGNTGTITGTYSVTGHYDNVVVSLDAWGAGDPANIACTPTSGQFVCVYPYESGYDGTQTIDFIATGGQSPS